MVKKYIHKDTKREVEVMRYTYPVTREFLDWAKVRKYTEEVTTRVKIFNGEKEETKNTRLIFYIGMSNVRCELENGWYAIKFLNPDDRFWIDTVQPRIFEEEYEEIKNNPNTYHSSSNKVCLEDFNNLKKEFNNLKTDYENLKKDYDKVVKDWKEPMFSFIETNLKNVCLEIMNKYEDNWNLP